MGRSVYIRHGDGRRSTRVRVNAHRYAPGIWVRIDGHEGHMSPDDAMSLINQVADILENQPGSD